MQKGTSKGGIRYKIGKPEMYDDNSGENLSIESIPDKFGRYINISRQVTPRPGATLANDTLYTAFLHTNNGDIPKGGYGDQFINQYGNYSSGMLPKNIGRGQFKTWGDYFKYLLSLKK